MCWVVSPLGADTLCVVCLHPVGTCSDEGERSPAAQLLRRRTGGSHQARDQLPTQPRPCRRPQDSRPDTGEGEECDTQGEGVHQAIPSLIPLAVHNPHLICAVLLASPPSTHSWETASPSSCWRPPRTPSSGCWSPPCPSPSAPSPTRCARLLIQLGLIGGWRGCVCQQEREGFL